MYNNDILRRLRYALNIDDATMQDIFSISGYKIEREDIISLLKKEDEVDFLECSNDVIISFLDGLILHKRGKQENKPVATKKQLILNNNIILKKIRIALNFKEENMLATFKSAGVNVSKSELTALFRSSNHKHYKKCGDQFIRNFLQGLSLKV